MSKPTVVLIDSDTMLSDMYTLQLRQRFNVVVAKRAQDAISIIDEQGADVIITDMVVARNNGLEVIHELRSYDDWAEIPVIVLSSLPERSFAAKPDWSRYNVSNFLYKARTSPKTLMLAVSEALG